MFQRDEQFKMANRGGQHVDAVTERRLKPIYGELDYYLATLKI